MAKKKTKKRKTRPEFEEEKREKDAEKFEAQKKELTKSEFPDHVIRIAKDAVERGDGQRQKFMIGELVLTADEIVGGK